jgi:hypothetical protein
MYTVYAQSMNTAYYMRGKGGEGRGGGIPSYLASGFDPKLDTRESSVVVDIVDSRTPPPRAFITKYCK